jgi:N-acetylmuramoyl-L-alanine amidase
MSSKVVGISTGHSIIDPGAIGVDGTKEFDLNKSFVDKLLFYKYADFRWEVVDKDCEDMKYPDHLYATVARINEVKPDCCVEVHHNAAYNRGVRGGMCIYYDNSEKGKLLSDLITRYMGVYGKLASLSFRDSWVAKKDYMAKSIPTLRHLKRRLYYLRKTIVPSVIIEPGYISNTKDLKLVRKYQHLFVAAAFQGVVEWLKRNQ